MKFKPILFQTEMVKAIKGHYKSQTRRLHDLKVEVGDVLWVRETFSVNEQQTIYRADVCSKYDLPHGMKWKPSIFMPKLTCRLFLEVTEVGIQPLQEITRQDALKEGIAREHTGSERIFYFYPCKDLRDNSYVTDPVLSFYSLWRSINGEKSWDDNPMVYVYDFKVVDKPINFLN